MNSLERTISTLLLVALAIFLLLVLFGRKERSAQ